jgi:hypothetical protein
MEKGNKRAGRRNSRPFRQISFLSVHWPQAGLILRWIRIERLFTMRVELDIKAIDRFPVLIQQIFAWGIVGFVCLRPAERRNAGQLGPLVNGFTQCATIFRGHQLSVDGSRSTHASAPAMVIKSAPGT